MAREVRIVAKERKEPDLQLIASALLDLVFKEQQQDQDDDRSEEAA